MTAGAHGHGLMIDRREGVFRGIPHCARSEIQGTQKHSRERQAHIVFGLGFPAPLAPFHSAHAFCIDQVRPGASHACGLLVAMEINQHVALRGLAANFMVIVHHQLVAALHKVNFDSFDSPFLELVERGSHLIVQRFPRGPKNQPDILLLRVCRQLLHVDFRHNLEQIAQFVPAVIENDVGDTVLRREINVVLVCLRVDSRVEVYAIDVPVIPPVPRYLAGLNP